MRRLIFAANWKMHLGPAAAARFMARFLDVAPVAPGRELWFFPPAVSIPTVVAALGSRGDARVGAQNVHWEPKGAFTGEMSVAIAAEAGATAALVGHSERRHVFGESDQQTRLKVRAVLGGGLAPMLCVGEKLEQREAGETSAVVIRQLDAALDGLTPAELAQTLIAYEPVWAIGTGHNATPEDAAAVHGVIRGHLARIGAPPEVPVLYGGSVSVKNVLSLLARPEIDGVLVGGASLDPDGWAEVVGPGA